MGSSSGDGSGSGSGFGFDTGVGFVFGLLDLLDVGFVDCVLSTEADPSVCGCIATPLALLVLQRFWLII